MNTQPQMKLLQVVLLTMMQGVGVIVIDRLASAEIPARSQLYSAKLRTGLLRYMIKVI